ncbi:hypothetical protein IGI39_004525 [Enterococcus sp. AZ135]|uniref:restriction endonuclease subunit S n=1 Tax=unclassified Enterococcus TaxID=2608891 RepID=UPI003F22361F
MRLNELLEIESGTLATRIDEQEDGKKYFLYENEQFYSQYASDMMKNRKSIATFTNVKQIFSGDIVINLFKGECTIVREEFHGNVIYANFAKVTFLDKKIDRNYFVYWFNESEASKKQLLQDIQGTVMKKITIGKLKNMEIELPAIDVQKTIGDLYIAQLRLNFLCDKNIKLKQLRTREMIRRYERGVEKDGQH